MLSCLSSGSSPTPLQTSWSSRGAPHSSALSSYRATDRLGGRLVCLLVELATACSALPKSFPSPMEKESQREGGASNSSSKKQLGTLSRVGWTTVIPGPLCGLTSTRESPEFGVWGMHRQTVGAGNTVESWAGGTGSSRLAPALGLYPPCLQGHSASSVKPEARTGPATGLRLRC